MMVKVRAPAGPVRGEVLQLAQTVRSRVVEVAEESVTLVVTGDAGKMAAVLKTLARFGIVELARTGRVALKRGEQLFDSTAAWEGRRAAAAAALCGAVGWVLAGWGAVTGGVSMDWWAVCSCGRL
jgi:acetolactate synthase-1/3 small subunit